MIYLPLSMDILILLISVLSFYQDTSPGTCVYDTEVGIKSRDVLLEGETFGEEFILYDF